MADKNTSGGVLLMGKGFNNDFNDFNNVVIDVKIKRNQPISDAAMTFRAAARVMEHMNKHDATTPEGAYEIACLMLDVKSLMDTAGTMLDSEFQKLKKFCVEKGVCTAD